MNHVVAVAAPIGGGKTSLVKAIAGQLNHAAIIFFDHYEKMTGLSAQDLEKWIDRGTNCHNFPVPGLADDLKKLKQGQSVFDPVAKTEIKPTRYIIFEMPMGREYPDTAGHIDLLVWIDLPLEVALARKLKEYTGNFLARSGDPNPRMFISWLDLYLENYLKVVRRVLLIQQQKVGGSADIIIDGMSDIDSMARQAAGEIVARLPG